MQPRLGASGRFVGSKNAHLGRRLVDTTPLRRGFAPEATVEKIHEVQMRRCGVFRIEIHVLRYCADLVFGDKFEDVSKGYVCPSCGSELEVIGDSRSHLRVCRNCKVIQWDEDGRTETRYPVLEPPETRFN